MSVWSTRRIGGIGTVLALLALPVAPAFAVAIRLPAPVRTGPAADVVVPIVVDPAADVSTLTASFAYDDSVIEPTAVFRTAATMDWMLDADFGVQGVVSLSLEGETPLGAAGAQEVVWVLFQVVGAAGSQSSLQWTAAELNSGELAVTTQNGQVQVVVAERTVSVPDDLQGVPGTPLLVPVNFSNVGGAEGIDIILRYNTAVLNAVDVDTTALTASMQPTFYLGFPGEVRISLWAVTPLAPNAGPAVHVTFDTVGAFEDATPLDLTKGVINEGQITTWLDDGLLVLCDPVDGDRDGFSGCAGDCDNESDQVQPGGTEVCDELDNDCNGSADDGIPPPTGAPGLTLELVDGNVRLDWSTLAGADTYDVLRGDLAALLGSDGDFSVAVESCLADDLATTELDDTSPDGDALWYLVRGANCGGGGSYDSFGPEQSGSRDAEIATSNDECP